MAAGVVLAVALLPGCGEDADPLELVSTAGAETADDGVARVTSTTELSLGGASITLESRGLVDFDHHRASLTTKLPSGGGDTEVVVDGTTMYLRGAGVGGELGLLTPWVSIDLGRMGGLTGTDLAQLGSSNEPISGLELLTGAEEVEEVGHEEVRGAATTHYRATVDLRKAVEEAGAVTDPDQFEKFAELPGGRPGRRGRVAGRRGPGPPHALRAADARGRGGIGDGDGRARRLRRDERIEVPPPTDVTDVTERILQDG